VRSVPAIPLRKQFLQLVVFFCEFSRLNRRVPGEILSNESFTGYLLPENYGRIASGATHSAFGTPHVSGNCGYADSRPFRKQISIPANDYHFLHCRVSGLQKVVSGPTEPCHLLSGHGWIRPAVAGRWEGAFKGG